MRGAFPIRFSIGLLLLTSCAREDSQLASLARAADKPVAASQDDELIAEAANSHPLPGHVVGVVGRIPKAVLEDTGQTAPENVFGFFVGQEPPRLFYLKGGNEDDSAVVLVGETAPKRQRFTGVLLADRELGKRHGMTRPYALVEVEVNGGLGAPASAEFVATQVRVLDGIGDNHWKVDELVIDARRRFERTLAEERSSIDEAFSQAATKVSEKLDPGKREARERWDGASWDSKTARIDVECVVRRAVKPTKSGIGNEPKLPNGETPDVEGVPYGPTFGVVARQRFSYADGKLVEDHKLRIASFAAELPPPK